MRPKLGGWNPSDFKLRHYLIVLSLERRRSTGYHSRYPGLQTPGQMGAPIQVCIRSSIAGRVQLGLMLGPTRLLPRYA